mgnify:CR=1 FL=1
MNKEDFKLASSGNARVGYCSKCGGKGFYDKDKIHEMKSKGCNADLVPEGKRGKWCQ